MRELLKGAVDLHAHTGPSVTARSVDVVEMMRAAEAAGYRAVVIKDHYFPTMMTAQQAEKHVGNGTTRMFGGIVLNNAVGAFNLQAVDVACRMGAKFVSMPTLSARHHIEAHQGQHFAGASDALREEPLTVLDDGGRLKNEVVQIIDYLAQQPDVILSTGHGTPAEVDAVVCEAAKKGVKKILVNHPFFTVGASMKQIIKWSELGAYIELTASAFPKFVSPDVAMDIIAHVDPGQMVIDCDSGQKGTEPVEVLLRFINILVKDNGVPEEKIDLMLKTTPAMLLGI